MDNSFYYRGKAFVIGKEQSSYFFPNIWSENFNQNNFTITLIFHKTDYYTMVVAFI